MSRWYYILLVCLVGCAERSRAQPALQGALDRLEQWLEPADSLHKRRFWLSVGIGTALYGAASAGLWFAWYRNFPLSRFHFYNDWGEWRHVDKAGHLFTAYNEARWVYGGGRWTGMPERQAAWIGAAVGLGLQTTIEVMDGFSEKWGFSWPDMAFNVLGAGAFVVQQLGWGEQRIVWKVSNSYPSYPEQYVPSVDDTGVPAWLPDRARAIYGEGIGERFIKDYNGMTIWTSVNVASFAGVETKWPPWLNVAVGYGAENMYGGYRNEWPAEAPRYVLPQDEFPRYSQFYLSPDIDLTRVPTRSRLLRLLFGMMNFVKVPAPTLEYNTLGQLRWHWLYW